MIGQKNNIELIKRLNKENNLKSFILICGTANSGKKELCKEIAYILNYDYIFIDNNIEAIREMLLEAYNRNANRLFIIHNIENLNFRAQELLLKVSEETPKNCVIIATTNNEYLIKDTIKNRALKINIELYSKNELLEYSRLKSIPIKPQFLLGNSIYSPSLINYFTTDILKVYIAEVEKFINKINIIRAGNALKAVEIFNIKETDKKVIDFNKFILILLDYIREYVPQNKLVSELSTLILKIRNEYNINSISKEYLIKDFIIKYRQIGYKYGFNGITK